MVARRTSQAPIRVITFPAGRPSRDDDRLIRDVLFESNKFYNELVRAERDRREKYDAIRREMSPELDAAKVELDAANAAVEAAIEACGGAKAASWRKTGKATDVVPEELRTAEHAAKERRKQAAKAFKEARAAFEEPLRPAREAFKERVAALANGLDPKGVGKHPKYIAQAKVTVLKAMLGEPQWPEEWKRIQELDAESHGLSRAARERAPLSGACADDAEERFRSGRDKTLKETGGPPKFRRFDGSGKLPAKLQKKGDQDVRWSELWDGSLPIAIRPAPPRAAAPKTQRPGPQARTSSRVRVPIDRRYAIASIFVRDPATGEKKRVELPIKITHHLPPETAIKRAWVLVRRRGERTLYTLQLVAEHGSFAIPKRPSGVGTVAMNIGWRKQASGDVRVAYWVGSDGEHGEILVPERMVRMLDHPDMLQGFRDTHRGEALRVIARVAAANGSRFSNGERDTRRDDRRRALRVHGDAYARHVLGDRLWTLWAEWKSERLARSTPRTLGANLKTACRWARRHGLKAASERLAWYLWIWARQDRHLHEYDVEERAAGTNRRRYFIRHEFIRLATRYGYLVTDDTKLAEIVERKRGAEAENDPHEQARRQRKLVAPGECRATARDVFGKERSIEVAASGAGTTCAECGQLLLGDKMASIRACPTHGAILVDENHCRNLLARASGSVTGSDPGGARGGRKDAAREREPVAAE